MIKFAAEAGAIDENSAVRDGWLHSSVRAQT